MESEASLGDSPGRPSTVSEALDALDLGAFHWLHLARMIGAWMIFAMAQESTSYMFSGLKQDFAADDAGIARFAASFHLGCVIGAGLGAVAVDVFGRRLSVLLGAPAAALLSFSACYSASLLQLTIARTLQAAAWQITIMGMQTWYIEFLPTQHRGSLQAVFCLGWPIGRGVVILSSSQFGDSWQFFMMLSTFSFLCLAAYMSCALESPRFLVANGRSAEANHVLSTMYKMNGKDWDSDSDLRLDGASLQSGEDWLGMLTTSYRCRFLFSLSVFGILSITTVLIDTWGPAAFQKFFFPGSDELPHSILLLFNLGDLMGVTSAIFLNDRLGRRGTFSLGFFAQGSFYLAMLATASIPGTPGTAIAIGFGTLAAVCRCFAWEAASMWTLEAFPTRLRGKVLGIAQCWMRLLSVASLQASAHVLGTQHPITALKTFGLLLIAGGAIVTASLPTDTAGVPLSEGPADPGSSKTGSRV
mmetsp:Transcript_13872/g.24429  ORF Transcript_13872/g.24429 Transcript_13872/m.24429 type:complete len:473 (-) Transcript_13872:177-1595(-)